MSEPRTAYDELTPAQRMTADCRACERELDLRRAVARPQDRHQPRFERAAQAAVAGDVPSLHFEDFPREVGKREIRISDAAARLAGALHLHLD